MLANRYGALVSASMSGLKRLFEMVSGPFFTNQQECRATLGRAQEAVKFENRLLGPTNYFQLLKTAIGVVDPTQLVLARCSIALTRINNAFVAQRRSRDRRQNRLQRCDGRNRCPGQSGK